MISNHQDDGIRFGALPGTPIFGVREWSRILGLSLLAALMTLMGCQTTQMRDLRKMGVYPEDIADRIANEGETPVGYSQHVPPVEEKAPPAKGPVGILNRGQEPDANPQNTLPPNSPPPLPSGRNEGPIPKNAPSATPPYILIKQEGLGAAELKTSDQKKTKADSYDGILKPPSEIQRPSLTKPSIFDVPTLHERATQLGRKYSGSRVVATVNGRAILEEELTMALITSPSGDDPTEKSRRNQVLNTLIDREVAIYDAETKLGKIPQGKILLGKLFEMGTKEYDRFLRNISERNKVESIEELKIKLKAEGMQLELMKRQTERNSVAMIYLQELVRPKTDRVGHRELKDYYEQHPEVFLVPESIQWRDIFIARSKFNTPEEARKQAEMVAQKVRDGEDFVKLSKTYCHGDSALRDGEGFGSKAGEIKPPEAEPVLYKLKDGELAPILELNTGFHIIQLVKRQNGGKRTFDEKVQKEIRDRLKNEVANQEIKRILNEMRRNAIIEMMPET